MKQQTSTECPGARYKSADVVHELAVSSEVVLLCASCYAFSTYISTLKMEATCSSEKSISLSPDLRAHILDERAPRSCLYGNLESQENFIRILNMNLHDTTRIFTAANRRIRLIFQAASAMPLLSVIW
jgi:hypothetical protein